MPSDTSGGVEKLLLNLDPSKAPGPDGIVPRVLKELAKEIAPSLCLIYKRSFETGIIPKVWKMAYVAPIYKKGNIMKQVNVFGSFAA